MTPAARIAAAIEILDHLWAGETPIGRALNQWGKRNRYAGSGDRAAIGDLAHDRLRRWKSCCLTMSPARKAGDGRAALIGGLLLDGAVPGEIEALFSGARHAPAPLTDEERGRISEPRSPVPPDADIPCWLVDPLREALGENYVGAVTALSRRAPVDLRVNTLKSTPEEALRLLREQGMAVTNGPLSPTCLRLDGHDRALRATQAYRDGLVELQDAAGQAAVDMANARPGELVVDFCAGGGGKTLALAAAMAGEGRLIAHDIDPGRMQDLPARTARAGTRVELIETAGLGDLRSRCDLVFVDAPCSGSGAWRRQPEAKWRLTPERLGVLHKAQGEALAIAWRLVRPGGRLLYATCSLLRSENENQIAAFLQGEPEAHAPVPAQRWAPPLSDGFFAALINRQARQN